MQKDPPRARSTAQDLFKLGDMPWTDWELDFLQSIGARQHELTARQGEKLIELRDDAVWHTAVDGFSLAALIDVCCRLQDDLADHDAAFVEQLRAAGATRLRRKDARRLLRCARMLGELEPHQGRSLDRPPEADPDTVADPD